MKVKFFIYIFLLCNFSFGQTQVLIDNNWYLEKFVINGSNITYTENTNHSHIISFESLENEIILKSGYCLTMFGLVGNVSNNMFNYNSLYQYVIDCNFNNDDFTLLNTITSFYLFPNNNFTYNISDVNNYKQLIFVNPQGNSAIYNNVNLSMQVFNIENELILYPNPVDNILYFKSDFEINKIKIFGFDGKLIESRLLYTGSQIDFTDMKRGIYFLEFEQNGMLTRRKIIKK